MNRRKCLILKQTIGLSILAACGSLVEEVSYPPGTEAGAFCISCLLPIQEMNLQRDFGIRGRLMLKMQATIS